MAFNAGQQHPMPRMAFRFVQRCILLLALADATTGYAFEVITHPKVLLSSIERPRLQSVFGLRLDKWPDNQLIKVFVLPDSDAAHSDFVKTVLGIYPYQLRQSWDRLIYSGFAQGPQVVANEQEMLKRVAETPGAIGYVRNVSYGDKVHVLTVLERK